MSRHPSRRQLLATAGSAWLLLQARPAAAVSATETLQQVVRNWAAGRPVTEGRVVLEVQPLVENGNAVPIRVRIDSPMTSADHVQEIVVFNERNPQRDVVRAAFGPASGRAQLDTRIRLATSQRLVALARLRDGSQWSANVAVVVTLAACIE
ncbi:MAG: sulfur oxidation protein SoxY, partial [Burkholderiales bacterium PBB5]